VILDEFITWALTKPEVLPNQQSTSGFKYGEDWMKNVVFRHEILKNSTKTRKFSCRACARKVLLFSVTSQLGLENYLSYPCTRFGANGEKLRPLALTKMNISLHSKLVTAHEHCINLFWL